MEDQKPEVKKEPKNLKQIGIVVAVVGSIAAMFANVNFESFRSGFCEGYISNPSPSPSVIPEASSK